MPGSGVLVNVLGIIFGGLLGMAAGRLISERFQKTLMMACALAVLFLGLGGSLAQMLRASPDGTMTFVGSYMMVGSLILGALIGEAINLEDRMVTFGEWLKKRAGGESDSRFVDAFVTASLTVCIGAMAVIGPINDRLLGDSVVLYIKTVLDLVIVLLMTATLGRGCIFSAISVGIFEGAIFLCAGLLEPVMSPAAQSNLSYVGNILIFCVGVNLLWKTGIRVANLLPALVIAIAWAWF